MRWRTRLLAMAALLLVCACTEPGRPLVVTDPDPAVKIPAIKKAVADKDFQAIGPMIEALDSDDPAVRLFAVQGLRRLTDEDFGYAYYADRPARQVPILKWQAWYAAERLRRAGAAAERKGN